MQVWSSPAPRVGSTWKLCQNTRSMVDDNGTPTSRIFVRTTALAPRYPFLPIPDARVRQSEASASAAPSNSWHA